jgi:CheY-like chemotaxis protein
LARKILLADDSVTAQNMGRKILADAGYEVITVNNGSAALKKIAEQKPDLIVLDVYMPGYSGLEVCQRLKDAQETSRVPVLLTVGKLEPFKPEEAKRVRADGFIVKPFEASELLSALSKLEDKIVPRSESSKPGRFARATAALDEGRYDKSVAIEEDSGWKNRIAFPPKKKKEESAEENGDDPAIYNAMNKDLRTVVEHKPEDTPHEAKAEEAKVDLGALAPEGLPKDVTPEEIAALAAAAAQVKGKIAEIEAETGVQPEHKTESSQPAAERPREVTEAQATGATFAEQKSEEKIAAELDKSAEVSKEEAASAAAPSPADVMAAISSLESTVGTSGAVGSGNGSWLHQATDRSADEPVTMAVAAGAGSTAGGSRWKAVSVALAPEEGTISLEQEMQKANAAFAPAESDHAAHNLVTPESPSASVGIAPASETAPAETSLEAPAVPASPASEATETSSTAASPTPELISSAVKEFETVATPHVEQAAPAPTAAEAAPVEKSEAAPSLAETPETITEKTVAESAAVVPSPVEAAEPETPKSETAQAEIAQPAQQESTPQKEGEPKSEPAPVAAAVSAESGEEAASKNEDVPENSPVPANDNPTDQTPASPVADAVRTEPDPSEMTAAAWASWRRVRESGNSSATSAETEKNKTENEISAPEDAAARAVAAGAEKAPEDGATSASDTEGIASIVDSVLADLRPKIYEEISRKMGKKK